MGFSENLFHMRTSANMTQEQLAMLMGVSRQAISKWESGRSYPEMDKLVHLCAVFECGLDELVNGDLADRAVRQGLVVAARPPAADACGYDRHMRSRAALLASAPAVALLGLAALFGMSGWGTFTETRALQMLAQPLHNPGGMVVLAIALMAAIVLAALAIVGHLRYRGFHPCVEDFYAQEQREQAETLVRRSRIGAAIACAVGIAACLVKAGPLCHAGGGFCSLFAFGAVAVWLLVFSRLMRARLDVRGYNERNARMIEVQEAASAYAIAPQGRGADAAGAEVPHLALAWRKRQAGILCGAALAFFGTIAVLFALLDWVIFFIPLLAGGILAGLIWFFWPYAG